MYTTSWCPYCVRAKQLLARKGVAPDAISEINIEEVDGARQEMEQRSGRMTVPQIFIGETHVGGSDDLHALEQRGGLDELLSRG